MKKLSVRQQTHAWFDSEGPVWCPCCGVEPRVLLDGIDPQHLVCSCGEELTRVRHPAGAFLDLAKVQAWNKELARWQVEPSGVRRWPALARLLTGRRCQTFISWAETL